MNIHEKSWGTWVRAAAVHIMNRCVDVSITPCHADPNAHTVPRHTTPHHGTPRTPRYVDVSAWTRVCQETGSERAGERVREREREVDTFSFERKLPRDGGELATPFTED